VSQQLESHPSVPRPVDQQGGPEHPSPEGAHAMEGPHQEPHQEGHVDPAPGPADEIASGSDEMSEDSYPHVRLEVEVDPEFDEPGRIGSAAAMLPEKIWNVIGQLDIPTINLGDNPSPKAILDFVYQMERYRGLEKARLGPIMMKAFQGDREQGWCQQYGYDYEPIWKLMINWMLEKEEWIDLKMKLEKGERLGDDLDTHIKFFKLVAKYSGLRAEDDRTKRLFLKSVGPTVIPAILARQEDQTFRSFPSILRMARENKAMFDEMVKGEKEKQLEGAAVAAISTRIPQSVDEDYMKDLAYRTEAGEGVAAVSLKNRTGETPRRQFGSERPRRKSLCFFCGKTGHYAADCRLRKQLLKIMKDSAGTSRSCVRHQEDE